MLGFHQGAATDSGFFFGVSEFFSVQEWPMSEMGLFGVGPSIWYCTALSCGFCYELNHDNVGQHGLKRFD